MQEKTMKDFFNEKAKIWDSLEETPLSLIEELLSLIPIKEGDKVLDVACGTGVITPRLAKRSKCLVKGIDISDKMIEKANEKFKDNLLVSFSCQDFLSFDEKEYDVIVIYNAYPHFLSREAFKEALERNLKKGGVFAILHSLSREQLGVRHENCQCFSRVLEPVKEEASFYQDSFKILTAEEDDSSYRLICQKN